MNIEQQKELKRLQDQGCRVMVRHPVYVQGMGYVFEYDADYIAENKDDGIRRTVGQFGYKSNVYYDEPLRGVSVEDVWICKQYTPSK